MNISDLEMRGQGYFLLDKHTNGMILCKHTISM